MGFKMGFFLCLQLMEESPDLQSRDTLEQFIRILSSYHEESISRDLRYMVLLISYRYLS